MGANVFSRPQTQRDVLRMFVQAMGSQFDSGRAWLAADVAGRRVPGSGCHSMSGPAKRIKGGSAGPAGVVTVWQGIWLRGAR